MLKVTQINIKKLKIPNLETITNNKDTFIYHAGTEFVDNKITTETSIKFCKYFEDLKKSRQTVIQEIEKLNWGNGFYRRDIGFRIID